jgi:UDP-N-acetylglucosamine--N-acetylmuramyl-(pentapeptide) pyrophosphoryl-undecaprenol N-acetylglucosamine transferase
MKSHGVLFCGGGTGGHVLPGLAVAAALRGRGITGLRWIGDPERIEARLVPAADIPLLPLGLTRPRLANPRWIWRSLCQAWAVHQELKRNPPRAVVALGGYAALLPGLLAPLHRRPLIVMEQNARPGRTNTLLAKFASAVVTQFPEAATALPPGRVRQLGNPVRSIAPAPRCAAAALRVLVVGGSLAAKSLNDLVVLAAGELARIPGLEIVHLAGDEDRVRVANAYAEAGVKAEVHGFFSDMPSLYARIDLAVTRAGATTVAELCCAGIGALYIPLPWAADDHQTANAQAVVAVGGALLLPQASTRPGDIARVLGELVADRQRVAALGSAAQTLARPAAAERVADLVLASERTARPRLAAKAAARTSWRRSLIDAIQVRGPA